MKDTKLKFLSSISAILFIAFLIAGAVISFAAIARAEPVSLHCSDSAHLGFIDVDVDLSTARVTFTVSGATLGPFSAKITRNLVSWADNVGGAHNLSRVTNELTYCNNGCVKLPCVIATPKW